MKLERKQTYPTVSPIPFCLSTLISNNSSSVSSSRRMLHQFRLLMMNLPFAGDPSVSRTKRGSYSGRLSAIRSNQTHAFSHHLFARSLTVHTLVCFRREGVYHDGKIVCWTTELSQERVRSLSDTHGAFTIAPCERSFNSLDTQKA